MIAIYTLWVREVKKYFRSKSRIIGSLGQPILFLVALGFGLGPVFKKAGEGNYIQFLVPGIISMSILFLAVFSGISVIWDRQFGFLKETMVAPVSRWKIMLGRTLGGATVAIIQGFIVFAISFLAGFRLINPMALPITLIFMAFIALIFTALGTAIASVVEDMHGFQLIMNFLVMPIFFLSGALFPLDNLPKALYIIVRFDPLSYGVDGIRATLDGVSQFGLMTDFWVSFMAVIVLISIGSYLFNKIQV